MSAAQSATPTGHVMPAPVWREAVAVIGMLALPTILTSGTIWVVIVATVGWQRTHGLPIALPNRTDIGAMAFGLYAVGTWISVALAWRWAAARQLVADVCAFRRLTWLDGAIVVAGFLAAAYGVPPITRWVGVLIGARGHNYPVNLHHPFMLALLIFSAYLTAPIGEEILFRGLLVAWLRRLRCPIVATWLLSSIAFASIHLPIYGLAWSGAMFCFGGMLLAIRLWRGSLTPCWLVHLLFNMRGLVVFPLFGVVSHAIGG
ncbi:MAG TPA: type II CAAX endopeptidase family protein [Acetobacteraceae bacterium]